MNRKFHSKETREKISISNKGKHSRKFTEDHKKKISNALKGKPFTEEHKRKISYSTKGKKKSVDHIIKVNNSLKGLLVGERNGMFGKTHTDEVKMKLSSLQKGNKLFFGHTHTEEAKKKMSDVRKKLFKDKKFLENFYIYNKIGKIERPNKQEVRIINILNEICPGKYEFVGDFKLWINGRNPDFINKDKRRVIEFFGKYWHREEDVEERSNHFMKEGYETLIIWDYELKNIEKVKNKILKFEVY